MDNGERSKEGQIQLLVEYGSQHGQLQVNILEINNIILPAVKRLGISHIYVKSHVLNEKTKELLKNRGSVSGYFLPDATKEMKRKTEEVKLTLSCHNDDEENGNNEKSKKSKLRAALKKQRERFRLKRNSDRVKTVVNAAGDDHGRATLTFERPLYYPSVSLYQLQTHFLHLTICGRNVMTTRSYPIATTCIPLMIAIKQHHPAWYQLSYNPDLTIANPPVPETTTLVQDSWEKHEGNYTGRSVAWHMSERKESHQDNWLHKRKDYSRHLHSKGSKQSGQKAGKPTTTKSLAKTTNHTQDTSEQERDQHHDQQKRQSYQGGYSMNRHDSGVDLGHMGTRHDSIEELYFNTDDEWSEMDTAALNHPVQTGGLRKHQKQWTSEFVICAPSTDKKRTSHGNNLDMSSLSLNHGSSMNHKTFGETIRGF